MTSPCLERERHTPLVLVDTADLKEEDWLSWRHRGIGGSDAAAILGISPFRTAYDLYADKLELPKAFDDAGNWVALEMGHLLEDLVARIFERKTGLQVYQVKKMFQHPKYPFMLADVDYFVKLPNGETAILEIKTTNYHAKEHWWSDGREIVPAYYESQGSHYMTVMDLDQVFFCCLYGNNEDEVIIRQIKRDDSYEDEMIYLEQDFWENHVRAHIPLPYSERAELILKSIQRYTGLPDAKAPPAVLGPELSDRLNHYLQLKEEVKERNACVKVLKEELERDKALLIAEMGTSSSGLCENGETSYTITYKPVQSTGIHKDSLERLELLYPDIYQEFASVSTSMRFEVKKKNKEGSVKLRRRSTKMDNSQKSPILFQTTAAVTQLNQIQGFDPLKFLRRTKTAAGGEIWKLDLRYQKLWFRLAYPKGRLNLNRLIFTDSKAAFEANVYFNREDKEPAGQFTAMCTAEEAVNRDFVREAQDAALAQALTNAGFGIQFADVMADKGGERYGCGIPFPDSAPAQETAHRNAATETAAVSPDHAVTEDFQREEDS